MNIVFMGTPFFCIPTLEELWRDYNVKAVVCQPDRKAHRGHKVFPCPVKNFAVSKGIPVLQPEKVRKNDQFLQKLKKYEPDIIVVIAYGQILPKSVLDVARLGCINLHASLLPKYRGASPIQFSIMNGDKKTGVTSMMMNTKMDEGDILLQHEMDISEVDVVGTLHDKLAQLSARCAVETIEGLRDKTIEPKMQDHESATYTRLIKKEDGRVKWDQDAKKVFDHYRAMTPWPGFFTYFEDKYIKIIECHKGQGSGRPGEILKTENVIEIACMDGSIIVERLQMAGKKALDTKSFLNGNSWMKKGIVLN